LECKVLVSSRRLYWMTASPVGSGKVGLGVLETIWRGEERIKEKGKEEEGRNGPQTIFSRAVPKYGVTPALALLKAKLRLAHFSVESLLKLNVVGGPRSEVDGLRVGRAVVEGYLHPSVVEISIMCWSEAGVNDSAMDLWRIVRIPRSSILDCWLLYNTSCLVAVNCRSADCQHPIRCQSAIPLPIHLISTANEIMPGFTQKLRK